MRTEEEIRTYLESEEYDDHGRGEFSAGYCFGWESALEWVLDKETSDDDGLVCPRCGEMFHDEDMNNHPEEYHTCSQCGCISHRRCRGPLEDDQ